jgi:long-chain acyl-CoA synthetase
MVINNPFKARPVEDPVEDFLLTSVTPLTIPAMLAEASAKFGPRIAYQQKHGARWERLTFDETYRQAQEFAAGLIESGHQQGDRVAIIAENSLSWAVAYYGIAIAGGIAVPLYPELKAAEVEESISGSGARIVVVSARVLKRLGGAVQGAETIIVVGGKESRAGAPPRFMRRGRAGVVPFQQVIEQVTPESRAALESRHVAPDDPASIVYTSGTTGGMKGVTLTHKNFMSNVESIRRTVEVDEHDRIVLVLPMHHAFPFVVFLAGCSVGGEMTFENDLLRVRDRLEETKPTIFLGVPALFELMYRAIVQRIESEGRLPIFERGLRVVDVAKRRTGVNLGRLVFRELYQRLGGNLRFLLSGGAALKPEVALQYFRLGLPLLQGWGLSEASPVIAAQRWVPRKFFFSNYYEEHVGCVGQPLEGIEVALIDVPEKEIYVHLHGEGELIARGPNVFPGYWQAEEETRHAKLGDWLRTGDLGRIDEEGNIWITGRSKYVIVLDSGEKVVPDELEERFAACDVVQDICVLPRRQRNKVQVGAVVFPNLDAIRQRLEASSEPLSEAAVQKLVADALDTVARDLAPHKRVSEVILTDTPLPKTAILKVMRGRLPDSFSFDLKRWQENAVLQPAIPGSDGAEPEEQATEGQPHE